MINANLSLLPAEILDSIVRRPTVSWQDCVFLCSTCKRFSVLFASNNQELWKCKLEQTWPKLFSNVYADMLDQQLSAIRWKKELEARFVYGRQTIRELKLLSQKHYYDGEMSSASFHPFVEIHGNMNHERGQQFQIDAIEDILSDGQPTANLTIKYYGEKVIRFLRHQRLRDTWRAYLADSSPIPDEASSSVSDGFHCSERDVPGNMIKGALLFSSWFQPSYSIADRVVRRQLELIAQLTVDEVKSLYPNNSLVKHREGLCLTDAEAVDLPDSLYSSKHCKEILMCLNNVLFFQLKFKGNKAQYYEAENSFIDKVLERRTGIPISLCILYQGLASKLGVKTFLVNFPRHVMLRWRQYPELEDVRSQYSFIDVFEGGRFLEYQQLPSIFFNLPVFDDALSITSPSVSFRRMCNNLVEVGRQQENSSDGLLCLRNGLELSLVIDADDIETRMLLSRVYIHLNINLEEVKLMLNEINARDPTATGIVMFLRQSVESQMYGKRRLNKKKAVKHRSTLLSVQFAVGMIMRHKKYKYSCVICGWDPYCSASRDWICQMGVNNLSHKDKQPFYNVLVEDGSTRYAAQENLVIEENPRIIPHTEVGKYFCSFSGKYYVPNNEKSIEYPEDQAFAENMFETASNQPDN